MELNLKGKTALVTGASRGLGAEVVMELASEGVEVIAVARDELNLQKNVATIMDRYNVLAHYIVSDLLEPEACFLLCEEVKKKVGCPDIIIHNLGGTLGIRDIMVSSLDYVKVWNLNLGIGIDINNYFLPQMCSKGWGRIIHVSSLAAQRIDASIPYCSAKAALNAYVVGVGRSVAKDGVMICGILPGIFQYDGSQWFNLSIESPHKYNQFIKDRLPLGRMGKPEDIASIIVFLASDKGVYFSGDLIPVDAGMR